MHQGPLIGPLIGLWQPSHRPSHRSEPRRSISSSMKTKSSSITLEIQDTGMGVEEEV
jgi:hypothetical protein